jgi:hypothetical protein
MGGQTMLKFLRIQNEMASKKNSPAGTAGDSLACRLDSLVLWVGCARQESEERTKKKKERTKKKFGSQADHRERLPNWRPNQFTGGGVSCGPELHIAARWGERKAIYTLSVSQHCCVI